MKYDMAASIFAKGGRRFSSLRAPKAAISPPHSASLHGRAKVPRASRALRRIPRLKCVFPRPGEYADATNFRRSVDRDIPTNFYIGGLYIRLGLVK